jgi:hypothetical protein
MCILGEKTSDPVNNLINVSNILSKTISTNMMPTDTTQKPINKGETTVRRAHKAPPKNAEKVQSVVTFSDNCTKQVNATKQSSIPDEGNDPQWTTYFQ